MFLCMTLWLIMMHHQITLDYKPRLGKVGFRRHGWTKPRQRVQMGSVIKIPPSILPDFITGVKWNLNFWHHWKTIKLPQKVYCAQQTFQEWNLMLCPHRIGKLSICRRKSIVLCTAILHRMKLGSHEASRPKKVWLYWVLQTLSEWNLKLCLNWVFSLNLNSAQPHTLLCRLRAKNNAVLI